MNLLTVRARGFAALLHRAGPLCSVLPLVLALTVTACGGSPEAPSTIDPGNSLTGGKGSTPNDNGGSGNDDGGGSGDGDDEPIIDIGNNPSCTPKTCEDLEKNCGKLPDGCGEVLDCGECEDGVCGLNTPNVCATREELDELCNPLPEEEACAGKECGVEGDGCGGTYDCGSCESGEACGIETPFQCDPVEVGSSEECPAKIESCASVGADCGFVGNGCGGLIDCNAETGGCTDGAVCGLGGAEICGDPVPECVPLEPEVACAGKCGIVSNGCGVDVDNGQIDCSALFPCPSGETCGGSGVPNQCGSAGQACHPIDQEAACQDRVCGQVGDGCDGSYSCGPTCAAGSVCINGSCETPPSTCQVTPKATACAGKECGQVGDGCGGTYDCGTCSGGEQCGVKTAFQCDAPGCVRRTQAEACAGKECGIAYDGCGTAAANQYNCGSCGSGEYCGIRSAFQCDTPPTPSCTPTVTTCQAAGWECGTFIDSCGGTHDCKAEGLECGPLEACTGGLNGTPATCQGAPGSSCTLCDAVPNCTAEAQPTRLRGRVITPGRDNNNTGNQVGVPNAFVYILRTNNLADLPAIPTGIPTGANGESCDRCQDQDLGPVLVSATTDATGAYTLQGNIPVGKEFLLVVKVGKFRRAQRMTLTASSAACKTTNLPQNAANNPTRLPRNRTDGLAVNIPRIAITTGEIDAMECVFSKMGIATSEFTNGAFSGNTVTDTQRRVHLFRGGSSSGSASGARLNSNSGATPPIPGISYDTTLYGNLDRLRNYDMIVADCEGASYDSNGNQRSDYGAALREYVNRGGRMFASHLSYTWLNGNGTQAYSSGQRFTTGLGPAATWSTSADSSTTSGAGAISIGRPRSSPRILNFADWMVSEDVIDARDDTFTITEPRSQATGLGTSTEEFVHLTSKNPSGTLRTQQFSFNTPYAAPAAAACGRVAYSGFHVVTGGGLSPYANVIFPDHCGGDLTGQEKVLLYQLFDLGACVGGEPTPPSCTKLTCAAHPGKCGTVPDGCGGTLTCGCPSGQICGSNNQCSAPGCVKQTQAQACNGIVCSTVSDGCGGSYSCACPVCTKVTKAVACASVTCGYASDGCSGVYECSDCPPECRPITECPPELECGVISNGCDGTLSCGTCPSGEVCGAESPNQCDRPVCPPLTCDDVGATCGLIGDGCGGSEECGTCAPGQVCTTANGVQQCEGCVPRSCESADAQCGLVGDGCGGVVDCGTCPEGQTCGAVEANRCGSGQCTPRSCEDADAECGKIGDGCGGQIDCGKCPSGEVCGLETPFQCDAPDCTRVTCEEVGAECGLISDGCSGLVDCGNCPSGLTCGLAAPNQCAQVK